MKKLDWSKYIGYILFVVTVIGWVFTAGRVSRDIQYLKEETKEDITEIKVILKEQQDLMMEQKEFNGKVIAFLEEDE